MVAMGMARHPKPYKKGKAQVTVPWKRRVLAKLAENKKAGLRPSNIDQLAEIVGAKKGGLNRLLDLDKMQLTSGDADEVTKVLGILPPVLENDGDDPDFARDVLLLRSLEPAARQDMMMIAGRLLKKPS
jgi:hypothetical protein